MSIDKVLASNLRKAREVAGESYLLFFFIKLYRSYIKTLDIII